MIKGSVNEVDLIQLWALANPCKVVTSTDSVARGLPVRHLGRKWGLGFGARKDWLEPGSELEFMLVSQCVLT